MLVTQGGCKNQVRMCVWKHGTPLEGSLCPERSHGCARDHTPFEPERTALRGHLQMDSTETIPATPGIPLSSEGVGSLSVWGLPLSSSAAAWAASCLCGEWGHGETAMDLESNKPALACQPATYNIENKVIHLLESEFPHLYNGATTPTPYSS